MRAGNTVIDRAAMSLRTIFLRKEDLDQEENPKLRVSSYFHSSLYPISSPCGTIINTLTNLT